jgi:hypothetical protein
MADEEQLRILRKGVAAWNEWRVKNPNVLRPDLSHAKVAGADLSDANLGGSDLTGADLTGTLLIQIDLRSLAIPLGFIPGRTSPGLRAKGAQSSPCLSPI